MPAQMAFMNLSSALLYKIQYHYILLILFMFSFTIIVIIIIIITSQILISEIFQTLRYLFLLQEILFA